MHGIRPNALRPALVLGVDLAFDRSFGGRFRGRSLPNIRFATASIYSNSVPNGTIIRLSPFVTNGDNRIDKALYPLVTNGDNSVPSGYNPIDNPLSPPVGGIINCSSAM